MTSEIRKLERRVQRDPMARALDRLLDKATKKYPLADRFEIVSWLGMHPTQADSVGIMKMARVSHRYEKAKKRRTG